MRYVITSLLVIAAIMLSGLAVGWLLPVRHAVSRSVRLPVTADAVYALISRVEDFPQWRSGVTRVEVIPRDSGTRQYREHGGDGAILYEVIDQEPPRRLVIQIADTTLPFGGRWIYEITPSGAGTELRITEQGEVYNPVFRFVSRFVMGHTRTIDRYLKDVERQIGTAAGT